MMGPVELFIVLLGACLIFGVPILVLVVILVLVNKSKPKTPPPGPDFSARLEALEQRVSEMEKARMDSQST